MHNRSKTEVEECERIFRLQPIEVDPEYPVANPDFNIRDEKPCLQAHIHNLFEIGFCYSGSGIFLIGEKILTFKTGDAVVINTREMHLAKANPGESTRWGFLNLDPVELLLRHIDGIGPCLNLSRYYGDNFRNLIEGESDSELTLCIRQIVEESQDRSDDGRSMIRALVWRMVLLLNRRFPEYAEESETGSGDDTALKRILPALDYLGSHFQKSVEIPHLAKLCFTSTANFRKLFLKTMGCAPQPYLLKMRREMACSMLKHTRETILNIALHCGYRSISNFNRQFLKEYGISPRDFREKNVKSGRFPLPGK